MGWEEEDEDALRRFGVHDFRHNLNLGLGSSVQFSSGPKPFVELFLEIYGMYFSFFSKKDGICVWENIVKKIRDQN